MSEVLVFQHDPFEDLGFFAEVLEKQGAEYRVIRLFQGEMPAEELENVGALIVLGGPMSVDEEETFPFLRWEKRIIRAAIDEAVPIRCLLWRTSDSCSSGNTSLSRLGEGNRLESDLDHAARPGGFAARLSAGKCYRVSVAR